MENNPVYFIGVILAQGLETYLEDKAWIQF